MTPAKFLMDAVAVTSSSLITAARQYARRDRAADDASFIGLDHVNRLDVTDCAQVSESFAKSLHLSY